MDIKNIKAIIDSDLGDEYKRKAILLIISQDEDAIPYLLEILGNERTQNKELVRDFNVELSRALVTLSQEPEKPSEKKEHKKLREFTIEEIKNHYLKYKDFIRCNFKIPGLP